MFKTSLEHIHRDTLISCNHAVSLLRTGQSYSMAFILRIKGPTEGMGGGTDHKGRVGCSTLSQPSRKETITGNCTVSGLSL